MDLSPCIPWQGRIRADGYGTLGVRLAHRAVYEREVGEIPDGLELDHLCRVRDCVNTDHLEPVTRQENIARSSVGQWQLRKTQCPRGHLYSPENTGMTNTSRYCKACKRIKVREWRERQKENA